MPTTFRYENLVENVIASLLEVDEDTAIDAFINQVVDVDSLVRKIGLDTVKEVLGENWKPQDIFTFEELNEWALENLDEPLDYELEDFFDEDY